MRLKLEGRIDLEHRACFGPAESTGLPTIFADRDGRCTLVGADLKIQRTFRAASGIRNLSLDLRHSRMALLDDDFRSISVLGLDGREIHEFRWPRPDGDDPGIPPGGCFNACHFDESGEFLWVAASTGHGENEVRLIETAGWSVVARARVPDPSGESSLSFHPTARPGLLSIMQADGCDVVRMFWLARDRGGSSCTLEPRIGLVYPPVFAPGGGRILTLHDDEDAIRRHDLPGMEPVGPPVRSGDEEYRLSGSIAFLDDRWALIATNGERIFLLDTDSMTIAGEVELEWPEPPVMKGYMLPPRPEDYLAKNINHFVRLGDVIVFVHYRYPWNDPSAWKDSLLWVSADRASRWARELGG